MAHREKLSIRSLSRTESGCLLSQPGGFECLVGAQVLPHSQDSPIAELEDVEQPLADLQTTCSATAMDP